MNKALLAADIPCMLQVELSSDCGLTCGTCPRTARRTLSSLQPGPMAESIWRKVVLAAREAGQVMVGGFGEALTDPQCLARLRQLDDLGVWTSLTTNGIALTPPVCRALAELRFLVHINISLDSLDPATYRELRGGELHAALRGTRHLLSVIDNPARVTVSSVLTRRALGSLATFPAALAKLGARHLILQRLIDYTADGEDKSWLDLPGTADELERIRDGCRQAGIEVSFSLPERQALELADPAQARRVYYGSWTAEPDDTRLCCMPWELPYVDKDGRVYVCCFSATRRTAMMGCLAEHNLLSIWQGHAYRAFRAQLLDGRTTPDVCQECSLVACGRHPLRRYAAEILAESKLYGPGLLRLVVRNIGTDAWTPETPLRIGTTNPRGRLSSCYQPGWLGSNRVAALTEKKVLPGEVGTFAFQADAPSGTRPEAFQLVVDSSCWLPGTRFVLEQAGPAWRGVGAWRLSGLANELDAQADVKMRDYRVRSGLPLLGGLIAWVRRNLTSHLREPYLDPTLERQVAFNRRAASWARQVSTSLAASAVHQAGLESRIQELEAQVEALSRSAKEDVS